MKKLFFLFILLVSIIHIPLMAKENQIMELNKGWTFRQADKTQEYEAKVPGDVHSDLLRKGLIGEPYFRLNEHNLQWIDKVDWEYRTIFDVDEALLAKKRIYLVFEGLDTYAEVTLNGKVVLQADNMFRNWQVEVRDHLKKNNNELKVLFHSAIKRGLEKLAFEKIQYPAPPNDLSEIGGIGNKKVSIFTRKAGYHYGWDWGPRLVTSGIWRPAKLVGWNEVTIENTFFRQLKISSQKAELLAILETESERELEVLIVIRNGKKILAESPVSLKPGQNRTEIPFEILQPKLWWPRGLGEQNLYELKAEMMVENRIVDEVSHQVGLRTLEVVQEPDQYGESFYFRVNGIPVFMKGANYIPNDVFLNQVTPEKYEFILESAADAHMNMLRVWGGGIYENDLFYKLCDQKGLLVWQDFMFACSMYPGDELFLANVRQEAVDNVKRLRNHPCLALWCGNNENRMGWTWWGWEKKISEEQGREVADKLYRIYEKMYHEILPETVDEHDPDRFYWSSSPSAGMGELPSNDKGDVHYWGVWWGKEPFSNYETVIPRFMSEFGFQSFPEFSTVKRYTKPEDYDIYSEVMKSHQRSSIGNETIEEYMLRDYHKPRDFATFLYVSQVLQAEGVGFGIEAHRRNRGKCMGTLFWQLNDCWPVASWSSIDYYGKWKALQYYAKKLYQPVLVSPHRENGKIDIHVISDLPDNRPAKLILTMMDFSGVVKWNKSSDIEISANEAHIYDSIEEEFLLKLGLKNKCLLKAVVEFPDGDIASQNVFYFDKPKNLEFDETEVNYSVNRAENEFFISLMSEKLVKNLYIMVEGCEGFLSDNYFDLLPGEKITLSFKPNQPMGDQNLHLSFMAINDL
ncbi:MAG: glycoside hydrolase family 2 protein [Candidatus Marinimicrobia bacterium]|nr:glycoside hydrolase family 2 protein [Candidatus Neomarinimicrobiota bacterium]